MRWDPVMTPDETREAMSSLRNDPCLDWREEVLLAEVDRLTAENGRIRSFSTASRGAEHERARILAAVKGLEIFEMDFLPKFLSRAAVIAAIKGETT